MNKTLISVRVDKDTKEQASEILRSIGYNLSSAINVFLERIVADGKLPFTPVPKIRSYKALDYVGMYLFYNPIEYPALVHLVSKKLGIDDLFGAGDRSKEAVWSLSELIKMANNTDDYDEVYVYLTDHDQAYFRRHKNPKKPDFVAYEASGWISLKGVKDGGGLLRDEWPVAAVVKKDGSVDMPEYAQKLSVGLEELDNLR